MTTAGIVATVVFGGVWSVACVYYNAWAHLAVFWFLLAVLTIESQGQ